MKLAQPLSKGEKDQLRHDMDVVRLRCLQMTGNPAPGAPRIDYLRCLPNLASSPFVVDHLEGAGFFVGTFMHMFPGFGLRQELENKAGAAAMGTNWCYEPYAPDNAPIGVQLADGYECVFVGKTPLQAVVRMVRLFLEHRDAVMDEVRDREDFIEAKPADVVGPEGLPAPMKGLPSDA